MTDSALRTLLRTTFEVFDIEVDEAADAAAAAGLIAAGRPDVVVLDVSMPGMSGIEFCRALKDDPATAQIPVVLLSGSAGKGGESRSRPWRRRSRRRTAAPSGTAGACGNTRWH